MEEHRPRQRVACLATSPLFSPALARRRKLGSRIQSSVNNVRSMRPSSRKATARPFCRG
jgi:hypothetical protein